MLNKDNNNLIKLKAEEVVTFGELTDINGKNIEPEYHGKYLGRDKKNHLIFGVCVVKSRNLKYKKDDDIRIAYSENKIKYSFTAIVAGVREAVEADEFDIKDMLVELKGNFDVDKYILELRGAGKPEFSSRREFFRMPLQMEIYFREITTKDLDKMTDAELKFEVEKARTHKIEADEGVLEDEAGYLKLITADISAGGFMFRSHEAFDADTYLECMLIVDREALPVVAKIISSRSDAILDGYLVHSQFHKISDPVRDRLLKYLISRQRQNHMRLTRR